MKMENLAEIPVVIASPQPVPVGCEDTRQLLGTEKPTIVGIVTLEAAFVTFTIQDPSCAGAVIDQAVVFPVMNCNGREPQSTVIEPVVRPWLVIFAPPVSGP